MVNLSVARAVKYLASVIFDISEEAARASPVSLHPVEYNLLGNTIDIVADQNVQHIRYIYLDQYGIFPALDKWLHWGKQAHTHHN